MKHAWRLLAIVFGLLAAQWLHAGPFAYVASDVGVTVIDTATNAPVATIPLPDANIFGNPVAAAPGAARAYVARAGYVYVIDTRAQAAMASIKVSAGLNVGVLALNPVRPALYASMAFDARSGFRTLEINTETNSATIFAFNTFWHDMAVSADGAKLYGLENGRLIVVDTATREPKATFDVGDSAQALLLHPRRNVAFISRTGQKPSVLALDLDTGDTIATIVVGFPGKMTIDAYGSRLFVADVVTSEVFVVDLSTYSVVRVVTLASPAWGIDVTPGGDRLFAGHVDRASISSVDTATGAVTEIPVGARPQQVGRFIGGDVSAKDPDMLSGLWWNPAEPGWGVHVSHRGSHIFAAWFTYDVRGRPRWYVSSDCVMNTPLPCPDCAGEATCTGNVYATTGPRFFADPYNAGNVAIDRLGLFQMGFGDSDHGAMSVVIGNTVKTMPLQRQVFRTGPPAFPVDYTDLWWNPLEPGWGIGITQQSGTMFLAWFAYDDSGTPVWFVASNCAMDAEGDGCTGELYRTTGPEDPLRNAFDPSRVRVGPVGPVTVTFTDANNGTVSYTVDGKSGARSITRQLF